jgi:hypothetical protein
MISSRISLCAGHEYDLAVLGCIHQQLLRPTMWLVAVVLSEVKPVESATTACSFGVDFVQNPSCLLEGLDDCVVLDRTTKIAQRPERRILQG